MQYDYDDYLEWLEIQREQDLIKQAEIETFRELNGFNEEGKKMN